MTTTVNFGMSRMKRKPILSSLLRLSKGFGLVYCEIGDVIFGQGEHRRIASYWAAFM